MDMTIIVDYLQVFW